MFNRVRALVIKELLAVLRDRRSRLSLIVPPILQLLLFSFTGTQEVKNIDLAVQNSDSGQVSHELVQRFAGSRNFRTVKFVDSEAAMRHAVDRQEVIVGVRFLPDFSERFLSGNEPRVQVILDGRRSNAAQIVNGYLSAILQQFADEQRVQTPAVAVANVTVLARSWFNPNLEYIWFTVPSLVVIITVLISLNVTSMSIAREREMGTFDQLLVSPLRPLEIMLGKTLPAFGLALAEATVFILVAVFLFRIPFHGSLALLYVALTAFITSVVGIGLFISALSTTQQQALLGTFTFMVPGLLMSGYASPIENMPAWLQPFTYANPLRYMMIIVKGVFLKAMPANEVLAQTWPMLVIALVTISVATWFFRHRLA